MRDSAAASPPGMARTARRRGEIPESTCLRPQDPGILGIERLIERPCCPCRSLIHVSAAFLKIARPWCHGGLIFALLWVTAQLPVPVLHAHGRHPEAPHELPLGQHVERCHGGELLADFLDWHVHWFTPQTVRKGLGETPADAPEEAPTPEGCPTLGSQELSLSEFMAWASSVSDAQSVLLAVEMMICVPTQVPGRDGGAVYSWYASSQLRLCQLQSWRC